MGHFFLILTIVSETAAVIFMKLSNGFQNRLQAAIALFAYFLSFIFLTYTLRHMPAGLSNAVWAGASTVLVAILGVFIFKEHLTVVQFIFLSMIVIGLIGLNLSKSL